MTNVMFWMTGIYCVIYTGRAIVAVAYNDEDLYDEMGDADMRVAVAVAFGWGFFLPHRLGMLPWAFVFWALLLITGVCYLFQL